MIDAIDEFLAEVTRALEAQQPLTAPEDAAALRGNLLARLDERIEYSTATEWADAVALCEALAVTGWGERERVDAIAHYNGDCWDTYFVNAQGEKRYRKGRWKKRKPGWVLFNPEYHFSPDKPDMPAKEWGVEAGTEFPVVDLPKLPSQRNYAKQMPIVMGVIEGPDGDAIGPLRQEFADVLQRTLRPNEYGEGLEKLYLTLQCQDWKPDSEPAGLRIGSYRAKQQAFACDLIVPSGFAKTRPAEQRAFLADGLRGAVAALRKKLARKKSSYDIDGLSRDVESAIGVWLSSWSGLTRALQDSASRKG